MSPSHYERLTALDTSFLELESDAVHMHVGSVGIFESGAFADTSGGIDFDRIRRLIDAVLSKTPRFRQKLAPAAFAGSPALPGNPIWVDDPHFNLLYHLRHTALPHPGDDRQLKRLFGRIMSEKLDRTKPMWEMWLVEGLEDGRVALFTKVHHCLVDGISGVDLLASFLSADPEHRPASADVRWVPRPPPSMAELAVDEIRRRVALPARALARVARAAGHPEESLREAAHTTQGFVEGLSHALHPASETPLNVPIGPHRRFDWTRFDLGVVREIKDRLGGTVNDVVLACIAGAVRRFLRDHGQRVTDIDFRVFIPVSTRTASQRGELGNRVSMVVASLPVGEPDARERMLRIVEETKHIKQSGQAEGVGALEEIGDWTATGLITSMARMAASRRIFNLVVTNVPGFQAPVYLDGARMLETYPLVPLYESQALGVALFSYDGGLYWGFNSCWDAMPDLHEFAQDVEREFETLRKL